MLLSQIRKAFEPIKKISAKEKTFDIEGLPITIRVLNPTEDSAVSDEASLVFNLIEEGDENSLRHLVKFNNVLKTQTLARAIIKIGAVDLHSVEYVDTEEFMADGQTPIKIAKSEALAKEISSWPAPLLVKAFVKYYELAVEVETATDNAIQFDANDIDTQIKWVEKRLSDLKDVKETRQKSQESSYDHIRKLIASENENAEVKDSEGGTSEGPNVMEPPREIPTPSIPIPTVPPAERKPARSAQEQPKPIYDSVVDASSLAEAVDQENARLLQMHMQSRKNPPHVEAARTERETPVLNSDNVEQLDPPTELSYRNPRFRR